MLNMSDELARSLRYMQENIRRAGPAAAASYTLIGAILLLGGVGFFVETPTVNIGSRARKG